VHQNVDRSKRWKPSLTDWAPPAEVRKRLLAWIDLEQVGAEGFWLWLETVLPSLPLPERGPAGSRTAAEPPEVRLRQIARDLADCARDRARLTIAASHYYQDNFILALRVKALEAGLAQLDRGRDKPTIAGDEEARAAADDYLTRGR
jgi:hypothetical protein